MSYSPTPGKTSDFNIKIKHVPTGNLVEFVGWVQNFSDDFASTWNEQPVYGRMDPLVTFQNTTRSISLQFDVVAGNLAEAHANNERLNRLIQFLYPVYERDPSFKGAGATAKRAAITAGNMQNPIVAAPLLQFKWSGLVHNSQNNGYLMGYLRGVNYNPDLNAGMFIEDDGSATTLVPQLINIQLEFTVLHTHLNGWSQAESAPMVFKRSAMSHGDGGGAVLAGGSGGGSWDIPHLRGNYAFGDPSNAEMTKFPHRGLSRSRPSPARGAEDPQEETPVRAANESAVLGQ
jgi:hypothetical protein